MAKRNAARAIWLAAGVALFLAVAPSVMAQDTAAPSTPKSHRMPLMRKFSYRCDRGAKVIVFLREKNAQVSFQGKAYAMKQVEAASGTKFSDGSIVWWSKGEEGFLEDETKAEQPVKLAENCKLEGAANSAAVTGTVAYRERMAMPEQALLTIQLEDVSPAEAPAKVIAEQRVAFAGHQVPLTFELPYDPAKIDAKRNYVLSARITVDGQLMFLNTTAYRVITQGNPVQADIVLQMVEGQRKATKH